MDFLLNPAIAIYIALAVALAVWLGIFALLWRLDRQARALEQRLDAAPHTEQATPRATIEKRSSRADLPALADPRTTD